MSWLPTVLNPLTFMWFLPLVLVPVVLHLLTLHRLKTVELPTFRFLFDSYVQQRRRTQFMEALLAMLRTLFMLLLVLVISRPIVKHWGGLFQGGSGHEVILVVDCSASMNAVTNGVSSIERAKLAATTVVSRLSPDDRVTLLRVTTKPEELFSQYSADSAAVKDRIESLSTRPTRANMFAAFRQLFGPEAPKRKDPLVYLFTDCQASGWKEAKQQSLEKLIPPEAQFLVVNVASTEDLPNLAVVGDAPPRRAIVGLPVELHARVVNHARSAAENLALSVVINDKEVHRFKLDHLEPGETVRRSFFYEPPEPGILRGRFELVGKSIDRFPDDDNFLFTLTVAPRVKVVVVNGNPTPDPFESEGLFLRTALTVTGGKEKESADKKLDIARALEVQEILEANVSVAALQGAGVVILANCGALNPQQFGILRDFVEAGGGLLIFPGERVNPDVYNNAFFPVPPPQKGHLTPVRLGKPEGDPDKSNTFDRLTSLDFSHPILSVFDDAKARYFSTVYFKRRFPLQLPEKRENAQPLAEFTNGSAALVESRFGDGRVLLAGFPANVKWTNLPTRYGEFVPLVLRMVDYVQHTAEVKGPSVVPDGAVAEIEAAATWKPVTGTVKDPRGHVTELTFEREGHWFKSAYTPGGERGYYVVEVKGGRGDAPKSGTVVFAVNLPPAESDFKRLKDQADFRDVLPTEKLTFVDASAEQQQEFGSIGNERESWRVFIYLLFLVIGVEFILASAGGAKRPIDETTTMAERIASVNPGTWIGRMTGGAARKKAE